jgi:hypothetical protein
MKLENARSRLLKFHVFKFHVFILCVICSGCIWGSARGPTEHYNLTEQDLPFQVRAAFESIFPQSQIRSALTVVSIEHGTEYKILFRTPHGALHTARFTALGQLVHDE